MKSSFVFAHQNPLYNIQYIKNEHYKLIIITNKPNGSMIYLLRMDVVELANILPQAIMVKMTQVKL